MIGGAGYMAGRSAAARASERAMAQEQRPAELEAEQPAPAMAPSPAARAPDRGGDLVGKLQELKTLTDEGVLTADEFAAAKQKLLAG